MEPIKKTTIALLAILLAFVGSAWERIKYETRHWPPLWHLVGAVLGALTAGIIMLHAVGLLDEFLAMIF